MFIFDFEPQIMYFVQSFANSALDFFFKIITQFGGETLCIVIMAFVYWCVDKQSGEIIGFATLFTASTNNILKDIFRFQRPIGYEGIKTDAGLAAELEIANSPTGYKYSYSFPSGHSQTAAAMYSTAARCLKKWWGYILAAVLILGVGISRMYVGVHWPKDVVVGWIEGLLISLILYKLLYGKSGKRKMITYLVLGLGVAAVGIIFAGSDDTVKSLGSVVGFIAGVAFENRFVKFEIKGVAWWKRAIRLAIGLVLLIGLKVGLKALLPGDLIFGFIRYFLLLFVGIGLYPLTFKKLKF